MPVNLFQDMLFQLLSHWLRCKYINFSIKYVSWFVPLEQEFNLCCWTQSTMRYATRCLHGTLKFIHGSLTQVWNLTFRFFCFICGKESMERPYYMWFGTWLCCYGYGHMNIWWTQEYRFAMGSTLWIYDGFRNLNVPYFALECYFFMGLQGYCFIGLKDVGDNFSLLALVLCNTSNTTKRTPRGNYNDTCIPFPLLITEAQPCTLICWKILH